MSNPYIVVAVALEEEWVWTYWPCGWVSGGYSRLHWVNILIPGLMFAASRLWLLSVRKYRLQGDWWADIFSWTVTVLLPCIFPQRVHSRNLWVVQPELRATCSLPPTEGLNEGAAILWPIDAIHLRLAYPALQFTRLHSCSCRGIEHRFGKGLLLTPAIYFAEYFQLGGKARANLQMWMRNCTSKHI